MLKRSALRSEVLLAVSAATPSPRVPDVPTPTRGQRYRFRPHAVARIVGDQGHAGRWS
jgi:hypothetical protein